jgi:excisionase family DNA binding protein
MEPSRKEAQLREEDMVTISEAAEEFDIPRIKLYRWMKTGRLVAFRSGRDERAKLVRRTDVAALLQPEPVRELETSEVKSAA